MDNELRRALAEGLRDSYKHCEVSGGTCAICQKTDRPFALHVFECSVTEGTPMPNWFVPMSASFGMTRGAGAVCDECLPPCKKCKLPIPKKKILKQISRLEAELPEGGRIRHGNGVCNDHIYLSALFG